jgi:predicted Zn-ribbon and HTH transcriptional regulator
MTRRKRILEALEANPMAAEEIATLVEAKVKTVLRDLEHIKLSLRNQGKGLYVEPPFCHSCGELIKVYKVKNVRKCPKCRSENISKAKFFIR